MNRFWNNVILPILNIVEPKNIVEIGSDTGLNTKNILNYCLKNDAYLTSIDPAHQLNLKLLNEQYGKHFKIFEDLSLNVLPHLDNYEVILIDGDHNWYTVFNELKIIEKQFDGDSFPFIIFHDIAWPYARRDLYYNPDNIPSEFVHPYKKAGMFPYKDELVEDKGLNTNFNNAISEKFHKNGVLTAIEDFIEESTLNLSFYKINLFNGLGLLFLKDSNLDYNIQQIILNSNMEEIQEKQYLNTILELNEIINTLRERNINLSKSKHLINQENNEMRKSIHFLTNRNNSLQVLNNKLTEKNLKINDKIKKIDEETLSNELLLKDNEFLTLLNSELKNKILLLEENNKKETHEKIILSKKLIKLTNKYQNVKKQNSSLNNHNNDLLYENKNLKDKENILLNSRSWKITKPFRKIKSFFK